MVPEILIVGEDGRRAELQARIASLGYETAGCPLSAVGDRFTGGQSPAAIVLCATGSEAASLMASLRRTPQGAAVPVTLYGRLGGQIRDLADVLDLGADHFLEEPAQDEQLLSVLEALAGPPAMAPSAASTTAPISAVSDEENAVVWPTRTHVFANDLDDDVEHTTQPQGNHDPLLQPLHRTLDRIDVRMREHDTADEAGDDLELSMLGLHDVPDPDPDGGHEAEEPPEPQEVEAMEASGSGALATSMPRETTVLLDETPVTVPRPFVTAVPTTDAPLRTETLQPAARGLEEDTTSESLSPVELQGSVEETSAPALLWRLRCARFSGAVVFERDRAEKQVWLRNGAIVFARSNVSADRFIASLYRSGTLTERQYETARRLAAREPRRAGQLLVEAGFIKPAELPVLLREQLARIVDSTFPWTHGSWTLRPGETCDETILISDSPARIIAEGVRLRLQSSQLWSLIGWAGQYPLLTRAAVCTADVIAHELDLPDPALAVWERLDGRTSLRDLVTDDPSIEGALLPLVYVLHVLGLCELLGEPVPASPREADEVDRERVMERLRLVREADYFAVLGVPREANAADIREAHAALRRTFDDDRLEPSVREEMRRELIELRAALDQALLLLEDEAVRAAYRRHLEESS